MIFINHDIQLSVIIPVYNVEKHLRSCIDSVLRSDSAEYEIILVDDGSKDGSPAICDEYRDRYEHIRVIHKENGGLSSARNAGMSAAEGRYYAFIDSDDTVGEGYIDFAVEQAKSGVDIIAFSYFVEYTEISELRSNDVPDMSDIGAADALRELEKCGAFNNAWNKLYSARLIREAPRSEFVLNMDPGEDLLFNADCIVKASSVTMINKAFYHWIRREEDTLANRFRKDLYQKNKVFIERRCEMYRRLGMEQTDKKLLAKGNLGYIFSCVPNMYRGRDTFKRRERIGFYKEIVNSPDVKKWVNDAEISGTLVKQFVRLYKTGSPFIMDSFYYTAMGARRKFDRLWHNIRKRTKR